MARTRLLKPGFFSNDLLAECDPLARLLFAGLWTLVDRDGRTECRHAKIKAQLLPYDDCDVGILLSQLADRGFVQVYSVGGKSYVQVDGFAKHQNPHPKETSEGLPEPPQNTGETQSHGNYMTSHGEDAASHGNSETSRAFSLLPSPLSLNPSVATSEPPKRRTRSQHPDAVSWSAADGWAGITDTDRSEWAAAFPGAVLAQELAKATAWLKANPQRAGRRNWRRFIVGWLQRCQDKGGTNREPGRRPEDRPPPGKPWRDQYQPAKYRTPKEVAALAAAVKLKEEDL